MLLFQSFVDRDTDVFLEDPNSPVRVATLTFLAPSDGTMMVTAAAEFDAGNGGTNGFIVAEIKNDELSIHLQNWDAGDADDRYDQAQSAATVAPVTAGEHTLTLDLTSRNAFTSNSVTGARLIVQFVPTPPPPPCPGVTANARPRTLTGTRGVC